MTTHWQENRGNAPNCCSELIKNSLTHPRSENRKQRVSSNWCRSRRRLHTLHPYSGNVLQQRCESIRKLPRWGNDVSRAPEYSDKKIRSSGRGGKANWGLEAAITALLLTYSIGREGEHPKGSQGCMCLRWERERALTAGNKGRSGG